MYDVKGLTTPRRPSFSRESTESGLNDYSRKKKKKKKGKRIVEKRKGGGVGGGMGAPLRRK